MGENIRKGKEDTQVVIGVDRELNDEVLGIMANIPGLLMVKD